MSKTLSVTKKSATDAPHPASNFPSLGGSPVGDAQTNAANTWKAFTQKRLQHASATSSTLAPDASKSSADLAPMSTVTLKPSGDVASPSSERALQGTGAPKSTGTSIPPPSFTRPEGVHSGVRERGYPLGFESMQQFRDLTRPVAQANREGTVIVSGSSVTGRSMKQGTEFDKGKKGKSDIDLGVIRDYHDPAWLEISDYRGFPKGKMAEVERSYGKSVKQALGRPTGIKFFDHDQIEQDGRSFMVRPHTPPVSPRGQPSGPSATTSVQTATLSSSEPKATGSTSARARDATPPKTSGGGGTKGGNVG
ncbi:hypothetical protein [Oleiagrimonas soli]|uniref:Uncharacterized protein n=2 Tax=Oleiagrimonas soli TaxID=1543381 RepID=A0A841KHR6_9GAMM|nr:hypothetical protein [Oleiagrimonas soli]MBB6183527.1 hypothetical protein [Oleiagrimonas soli]